MAEQGADSESRALANHRRMLYVGLAIYLPAVTARLAFGFPPGRFDWLNCIKWIGMAMVVAYMPLVYRAWQKSKRG